MRYGVQDKMTGKAQHETEGRIVRHETGNRRPGDGMCGENHRKKDLGCDLRRRRAGLIYYQMLVGDDHLLNVFYFPEIDKQLDGNINEQNNRQQFKWTHNLWLADNEFIVTQVSIIWFSFL